MTRVASATCASRAIITFPFSPCLISFRCLPFIPTLTILHNWNKTSSSHNNNNNKFNSLVIRCQCHPICGDAAAARKGMHATNSQMLFFSFKRSSFKLSSYLAYYFYLKRLSKFFSLFISSLICLYRLVNGCLLSIHCALQSCLFIYTLKSVRQQIKFIDKGRKEKSVALIHKSHLTEGFPLLVRATYSKHTLQFK